MIGGHGEGMKLGILRLLVCGHKVKYHTGRHIWHFFMKKRRGAGVDTLFYRSSNSRAKKSDLNCTTVHISNVSEGVFRLKDFLPIANDIISAVPESECDDGFLLDSKDTSLSKGRIYVKGIFVFHDPLLKVSVNFKNLQVSRDRELIANDTNLQRMLANMWNKLLKTTLTPPIKQTQASRSAQKVSKSSKYSKEMVGPRKDSEGRSSAERLNSFVAFFLKNAQMSTNSHEARSLEYMGVAAAGLLLQCIRKQDKNAFPFLEGIEVEEKLIMQSLRLSPYPCSKGLLKLLMLHDDVMTVYEAQEKLFLAGAAAADESVASLPLANMLRTCVAEATNGRISLGFQKAQRSNIRTLSRGNTLLCSEELVACNSSDKMEVQEAAIRAILEVERELTKDRKKNRAEIDQIAYGMRLFAVQSLSSFLPNCGEEEDGPDNIHDSEPESPYHHKRPYSAEDDDETGNSAEQEPSYKKRKTSEHTEQNRNPVNNVEEPHRENITSQHAGNIRSNESNPKEHKGSHGECCPEEGQKDDGEERNLEANQDVNNLTSTGNGNDRIYEPESTEKESTGAVVQKVEYLIDNNRPQSGGGKTTPSSRDFIQEKNPGTVGQGMDNAEAGNGQGDGGEQDSDENRANMEDETNAINFVEKNNVHIQNAVTREADGGNRVAVVQRSQNICSSKMLYSFRLSIGFYTVYVFHVAIGIPTVSFEKLAVRNFRQDVREGEDIMFAFRNATLKLQVFAASRSTETMLGRAGTCVRDFCLGGRSGTTDRSADAQDAEPRVGANGKTGNVGNGQFQTLHSFHLCVSSYRIDILQLIADVEDFRFVQRNTPISSGTSANEDTWKAIGASNGEELSSFRNDDLKVLVLKE